MTKQELIRLSIDVAEKYNISPYTIYIFSEKVWLHEDSGRCLDLAIEHGLTNVTWHSDCMIIEFDKLSKKYQVEHYSHYNNDKHLATCVAILKALLAKG